MKSREVGVVAASVGAFGSLTFAMGTYLPRSWQEPIDRDAAIEAVAPCKEEYRLESRTVGEFPTACAPVADYVPFDLVIDHTRYGLREFDENGVPLAEQYILAPVETFPTESEVSSSIQTDISAIEDDNRVLRNFLTGFGMLAGLASGTSDVRSRRYRARFRRAEAESTGTLTEETL